MLNKNDLIEKAFEVMQKGYAPYSGEKIGVCVYTDKSNYYTAANIETEKYNDKNCPERVAIFEALQKGDKNITKIVIGTSSDDFSYPCGICRQLIYECANSSEIILVNNKKEEKVHSINELLPYASPINNFKN